MFKMWRIIAILTFVLEVKAMENSCGLTSSIDNLAEVIRDNVNLQKNQQKQINDLTLELETLKASLKVNQKAINEKEKQLFFSVATSNRFNCFDCPITYNLVYVNSHPEAMDPGRGKFKAPSSGHYFFQFHALVEANTLAKVQIVINGQPVLHLYDNDIDGRNNRFAMISQAIIYKMNQGDTMYVNLHEGALKGGGTHAFTSLIGMRVGLHEENAII